MNGLELVVTLGIAVFVGGSLAQRIRVAEPVVLLLLGVAMFAVPGFRSIQLPPEYVLFLFLPALLFWEALTSSLRSLRTYVRGVVLISTVLVVLTAWAVAEVAHWFGVAWGAAWVLGAAVAPTDATVVAGMRRLLPGHALTMLRSESLLNDGTALVVYGVSVEIASGASSFSVGHVALSTVISIVGGVGIGLAMGWVSWRIRRWQDEPVLNNVMLILTPFIAYLLAELISASGVLAVVTAGLFLMRAAPHGVSAMPRQISAGFWGVVTRLLNGALFVLVGLYLPITWQDLRSVDMARAGLLGLALLVTLVIARLVFLVASAYLIRAVDRRPSQKKLRQSNRMRLVQAVAGFRGGVSLAIALSVPLHTAAGSVFPSRDVIIFATAVVVFGTVVLQGLLLPVVVRWADLPPDDTPERELHDAENESISAALDALPRLKRKHHVPDEAAEHIEAELRGHLEAVEAHQDGDPEHDAAQLADRIADLRTDLVEVRRRHVIAMRDEGRIDDEVAIALTRRLDTEEVRWTPSDEFA